MQKMTQAEKTMLRYQYVLANTGAAQGDFLRTINSWHNQLVLLTGAFQQLGSIVGGVLINAFKPFIQALNSVMGAVINFAQVVSDALGAIFGWEYQTGGGVANDMESAAGAAGDLEDATGGAAKNAKELNRYIAAWHEVNNMTSDEGSKGSGGGGGGGAGGGAGAADGGEWIQKESLWEKYTSDIDSLYELGDYISGVLTDAMNSINWDDVYKSAENFGSGLASFLNGLIKPELFSSIGTTLAGVLNTVLHGLDSFGQEFDWTNFGESVAAGINSFFNTYDFALQAETLNTWANGLLDALITGLDKVDWKNIGVQIGTFLENINFTEIGMKVGEAIWKAINAGFDILKGMFSVAPLETAILTLAGVTKLLKNDKIKKFTTALSDSITVATNFVGAFSGIPQSIEKLSSVFPGLTKAVDTCGTAFQQLMFGAHYGDWAGGISQATKTIRDNLTGVQKGILTAVSGFAEFNMVSSSIENLATGTGDLGANLIELASGAAIGAAGMYVALGPAGLAIAAITGLLAAIKGIDEAMKEKSGYNDLMDRLDDLEDNADRISQKSESIKESLQDAQTAFEESGSAQSEVAENLADKYDELHNKANPTAADIALMKQYSKDLVNMYPELEQFFNNETGLLETNRDTIQQVIDKNKALAKSNAALEGMEEAYKQQIEASKNLAEAKENEKNAQEEYNKAYRELQDYMDEHKNGGMIGGEYRRRLDAVNEAKDTLEGVKQSVVDAQGALDEAGESVEFFGDAYDETAKAAADSSEAIKQQFEDIGVTFDEKVLNKLNNSGEGGSSAILALFTNMKNGVTAGSEELTSAFEQVGISLPPALINAISSEEDTSLQNELTQMFLELASGVPQSAESLTKAFETLGFSLPDSFATELSNKSAVAQNSVLILLGQIESGVTLKQTELQQIFTGLGIDLPTNFVTALAEQNAVVQQDTITLLSQIEEGEKLKDADLKKMFSDLGVNLPDELITSIQSKEGETYDKAIELLMQMPNATDDKKQEILSKLKALGTDEGNSLIEGVNSKSEDYKGAGEQASNDIASGVSSAADGRGAGSLYEAGQKSGNSLLDGLKSIGAAIANWWSSLFEAPTVSSGGGGASRSRMVQLESYSSSPVASSIMPMSAGMNNLATSVNKFAVASRSGFGLQVPKINVMPDIGHYQYKPVALNPDKVVGQVREALDYTFASGGFIDYDRLGQAVYEAQSQAMQENPVKIGDNEIYSATRRAQSREFRRTGKTGWAGI